MPHSTSHSSSSTHTFTLDDAPTTTSSSTAATTTTTATTPNGRPSSFGVAVSSSTSNPTAPPTVEDKSRLSFGLQQAKRESTSVEDAYASLTGQNGNYVGAELSSRPRGASVSSANSNGGNGATHDRWSRRRSQNFDAPAHAAAYKETFGNTSRDRILRNSPVIAELKTNVIIKDEFTLVTDLSYHLAQRYSRPESCVMIKVDHSACLALGGGFEPCYILNISTIPTQTTAWSNRRNAALIQTFMAEILSVPAHRGIVKFEVVAEECWAMNGITVKGELEKVERQQAQQREIQESRNAAAAAAGSNPHRKSMSSFNVRKSETKPNRTINGAENLDSGNRELASPWGSTDGIVRPSTSHGFSGSASSHKSSFDGLRMNGISLDLSNNKNARDGLVRPKTLGASPAGSSDFVKTEAVVLAAASATTSVASKTTQAPIKSSLKSAFTSRNNSNSRATTPTISSPIPNKPPYPSQLQQTTTTSPLPNDLNNNNSNAIRPRTTHLDDMTTLAKSKDGKSAKSIPITTSQFSSSGEDYSTAANTAKRRATLTSTNPASNPGAEGYMSNGAAPSPAVKPSLRNGSAAGLDKLSNYNINSGSNNKGGGVGRNQLSPVPPPIPADSVNGKGETRSIRSFRLGQRRSAIFAAIKRGFVREESK